MHYCHIVQGTRHKPQWKKTERGSNVSKSSTKELKRAGNFQCEREFRFNITARAVKSRLRLLWGKVVGPAVQIQNIPDILVMKRSRSTHSTMTHFLQQSWKFMIPYINTVWTVLAMSLAVLAVCFHLNLACLSLLLVSANNTTDNLLIFITLVHCLFLGIYNAIVN